MPVAALGVVGGQGVHCHFLFSRKADQLFCRPSIRERQKQMYPGMFSGNPSLLGKRFQTVQERIVPPFVERPHPVQMAFVIAFLNKFLKDHLIYP